mmetsp:Transcript_7129/g.14016  ORF Transcript_7129/g.14016 Transcript_7129/m.14016 type:complete len:269 (+) Transcript_7129:261-1067(+)
MWRFLHDVIISQLAVYVKQTTLNLDGTREPLLVNVAPNTRFENHDAVCFTVHCPVWVIPVAEMIAIVCRDHHFTAVVVGAVLSRLTDIGNIDEALIANADASVVHIERLIIGENVFFFVFTSPRQPWVDPSKALSRSVETSGIRVIEVRRVVPGQTMRERLVVNEFDLIGWVLNYLCIQIPDIFHRAFKVAPVVSRTKEIDSVIKKISYVVNAVLDLYRILPTCPLRICGKQANVNKLRVVLAMIVYQCLSVWAPIAVRDAGRIRLLD